MEELLESNLLRHFRIVRFLLGREWVTIGELAHTLRIPSRTIRQSIGEINQYINPAKIESSQKFGIRLTYDAQLNSFYIYASIYKQSAHFLIIENICIHQYATLAVLAEKLFISQSTLKRKIAVINQTLEKYGFWIDTKSVDMVGDERKIRFFYYCYLLEKYDVLDLVAPEQELRVIDELISEFFAQFPSLQGPERQVFSYLNKLRTMLFISFKRLKKGRRLASHDQINEQYSLLLSEKLSKKIAVCYHIDCTKDVLHQLFFLFFNRRYAWSANDLQKKAEHDEAIAKVRRTLMAFFAKIEKSEQLDLINKDELLLLLYNATSYTWTSAKILHNPSEDFFVNLNHYHEGFARRIKKELVACLNREQLDIYLDDSVINQLLFMLVTAWKGLMDQLEASAPRVKAGIFFNTSFEHSQFLLNDISYHLKSRLDMTLITAKTITELRQQCQHVDMLITNLSMLPSPDCHIVSIQANLTPKDFENILSVYSEIVNANVTAS